MAPALRLGTQIHSAPRRVSWSRLDGHRFADPDCSGCMGSGLRAWGPCECATSRVFRLCLAAYRDLEESGWRSRPQRSWHPRSRITYSRPAEEYCAEFSLAARRALDQQDFRLFQHYFVFAIDARECAGILGLSQSSLRRAVARVERQVGAALKESSLLPTQYFSTNPS